MGYTPALGTTLGCDFTTPNTFVTINQVTNIGGDKETRQVETTHLGSTDAEFRPTIKDAGTLSFSIEYDPADASHISLEALWESKAVKQFRLGYPTTPAKAKVGQGFVTKFAESAGGAEEIYTIDVEVKLTGPFTWEEEE